MAEEQIPASDVSTDESVKEKKDQAVPYTRFKEVNDQLAQFKQLGMDPVEIVQELKDYRDLVVSIKDEAAKGDSALKESKSKLSPEKREQIKQELEELFPGISKLADIQQTAERASDASEAASRSHITNLQTQASKLVSKFVDEAGYDVGAAEQIEALVANSVYGNKTSLNKFLQGDLSVVKAAFDELDSSFLSKNLIKPVRSKKSTLPGLLTGNKGLSVDNKDNTPLTEEKLAKMSPGDRRAAIGKDAFDYYNQLAAARAAANEE